MTNILKWKEEFPPPEQITRNSLLEYYRELQTSGDKNPQARGYALEWLFLNLLKKVSEIPYKASFKSDYDQVDGWFELLGHRWLFETKWHKKELPASTIFEFRGKVELRFAGTFGLFLAINGFSEGAPFAARLSMRPGILLMNGEEFENYVLADDNGFEKVLKAKLRYASQKGNPYFSYVEIAKNESLYRELLL